MNTKSEIKNIELFINSKEFQDLQISSLNYFRNEEEFDILSLLDEFIVENTWSRLFCYLFDSSKAHKLNQKFFRQWLLLAASQNKEITYFLKSIPNEVDTQTIAIPEWQTDEFRRIDIVIYIQDHTGLKGIVGIENKLIVMSKLHKSQTIKMHYLNAFRKSLKSFFFLPQTEDDQLQTQLITKNALVSINHIKVLLMFVISFFLK